MSIKYVLFLIAAFCSTAAVAQVSTTWDKEIQVMQGEEEFPDKETYYAYSTVVYETSTSVIKKVVLDELDSRTEEKTKMKAMKEGVPVSFPEFNGEMVTVKVMSDDIKNLDQVKVAVAFFRDSVAINPTDFPDEDKAAQTIVRDLGVMLNKSVVELQIADANKQLESLQKDHDKLVRDTTNLVAGISKSNQNILKYQSSIKNDEIKLSKAQADAASLEVMAKSSSASPKDMKKYNNAQSKASSIESGILKSNQKIAKEEGNIKAAEMQQPILRKQIVDLMAQIDDQKTHIETLQAKLEAIQ